jgi:serine/threonine protein kinase
MAVHQPNTEPLPGYRLLEPLGKGGFGEVWKCEAPGGLVKAIKFVAGRGSHLGDPTNGAAQELRALQHVKSIRHPFLLSMDRVEVVNGDLLIVMELADSSLQDLLEDYQHKGQPGIPRDELLGYLREAAEVLDLMNQEHKLQHLDIKPRNLFLVSRHVKVADFGLVNSVAEMSAGQPASLHLGAITPIYAAPESFLGKVSPASDQYSLAVAYHEMLTGKLPFSGKNFRQLAMQHMQALPDLAALPEGDRPAVARALAKEAKDRFSSCGAFVEALILGDAGSVEVRVPARAYFALESGGRWPKPPTAHDAQLRETNSEGAAATVKQPVVPGAPATTPEFAGLQLVECLSRQAGGELWRGVTADGRKRLVHFLCGVDAGPGGDDPFVRLAHLKHDRLAKVEIVRDGPNRIGLVTEAGDENLGTRLKECTQSGQPGIPREELLDHLADVAEALDDLFDTHGVRHLTLSPRTVALLNGRGRVLDFGLAELFWMPAGQQPAALNPRYAAPELFDVGPSRHSDQFSLALMFQELLTGAHAFRNLNPRQVANARQRGTPDLGVMAAADRVLVLRALNPDPERRFASCGEFIEALSDVNPAPRAAVAPSTGRVAVVSPRHVTPLRATAAAPVASSKEAVNELLALAGQGREVRERGGFRYLLEPGKSIRHHCGARLIPGMVRLKVNTFRDLWKAKEVECQGEDRFLLHVPLPGSLWQRALGKRPGLAVDIRCELPTDEATKPTEAEIEIFPVDCGGQQAVEILETVGPHLLESLRTCLDTPAERRGEVRLPFAQPVKVVPVSEDDGRGEAIEARALNVSTGGMSVLMPRRPASAQVCVELALPSRREPATIAARVLRAKPHKDGRVEVALAFA